MTRRSPAPSPPAATGHRAAPTPAARQHQRQALLFDVWAGVLQALGVPGDRRAALVADHGAALAAWVAQLERHLPDDVVAACGAFLADRHRLAGLPAPPPPSALAAIFARCSLALAAGEVEAEARRAGHGDAFEALRPYLERELPGATATSLGPRLGLTAPALDKALGRLRRRFRQRVDAGLALWSSSPETARQLRHRLHAALVPEEPSP